MTERLRRKRATPHPTSQSPVDSYHMRPSTAHSGVRSDWTTSPSNRLAATPTDQVLQFNALDGYVGPLDVPQASTSSSDYIQATQTPKTLSGLYLDASVWPLSSKEGAGLLRYFVERLARNFDLTDPGQHFRNLVPQRAATCPLLLNAIFALSARHLSRIGDYDPLVSNRYHQECLERVTPILNDPAALLDENLLASTIILRHVEEFEVPISGSSPSDAQPHLLGSHAFIQAQRQATKAGGLRQAAFWVALRQEIYVAFVNQRSVTAAFENATIDWSLEAAGDHGHSCRMVGLCADVIRHCFGNQDKLTSEYDRLSNSVDEWHTSKSSSFTPVYYKEADQDSGFPDMWLLNDEITIGWQHYYIAKLLLCAHNPRLPCLGPGRAAALRATDEEIKQYVRVLCGIAISNPDTAPNFT